MTSTAPAVTVPQLREALSGDVILDRPGGTMPRLLRFAAATLRRRPDRAVLAVAGVGLAVCAVVVVRTIAVGYQDAGVQAVHTALHGAPYWAVPAGGVHYDPHAGTLVADGVPLEQAPAGWRAITTLTGTMPGRDDVGLIGTQSVPDGVAQATPAALSALRLHGGDELTVGGATLSVRAIEMPGTRIMVPVDVARAAGAVSGWTTLTPPAGTSDAGSALAADTGLRVVGDPSIRPDPGGTGLIYATDAGGRSGFLSFESKFAALLGGAVTSSVLGLVAEVGLVLGFVIAVTTFIASVHERRREFGIMASVGLSDEVLYFFLVESIMVFVAAFLFGVLAGGAVVALVLPSFFSFGSWLAASALVATYLPALAVVAALIPVHRLLQQRPVDLLAEHS